MSSQGNGSANEMLRPDDHPTFTETYKEMEKLLETGNSPHTISLKMS